MATGSRLIQDHEQKKLGAKRLFSQTFFLIRLVSAPFCSQGAFVNLLPCPYIISNHACLCSASLVSMHKCDSSPSEPIRNACCLLNHGMINLPTPGEPPPPPPRRNKAEELRTRLQHSSVVLWEQCTRGSIDIGDLVCSQVGLSYPTASLKRRYMELSLVLACELWRY